MMVEVDRGELPLAPRQPRDAEWRQLWSEKNAAAGSPVFAERRKMPRPEHKTKCLEKRQMSCGAAHIQGAGGPGMCDALRNARRTRWASRPAVAKLGKIEFVIYFSS